MLKTFIERPNLSAVISIIIVVLGIIGLYSLPVEQYPDIAPPTVRVTANYTGANADVVLRSVIVPLEEQINGVEGMQYMTSSASNSGTATINIFFAPGTEPDMAAVNVQNRVSKAAPLLPREVMEAGIATEKVQNSTILMIAMTSDNPDYDAEFVQNYTTINILPQIKRVYGVGDASVFDARDYSMRIWLKPDVMYAYQISPQEVIAALQDQNIEAATGELGQNSGQTFQYTLKYTGLLKSEAEFGNIIIRSTNGLILRLKDVADVELGSLNYTLLTKRDDNEAAIISVSQTPGTNARQVINNIKAQIDIASASFPPGIKATYTQDANRFLSESINKIIRTLLEAFLLVTLVVFIFLQNWRATLIPAIAVPVSILGTFFFLQLFGSINLLTLFALVLAIGTVVDDAIVVVEAIHTKLDEGEKDAKKPPLRPCRKSRPH